MIEDDLRRVLNDPRRTPGTWPDANERVRAGMRRRHQRRVIAVAAGAAVLAVAAVAAAASLGGNHPNGQIPATVRPSATDIIAFRDLPYSPPPNPINSPRASATPCRSTDLRLVNIEDGGAMGTEHHIVQVRNTGATRCTLAGHPALLRVNASRQVVVANTSTAAEESFDDPNSVPATIDPDESAYLDIRTYGGCLDGTRPTVAYDDVRLRLSGNDTLHLGAQLNATCGVEVGQWHRSEPAPPQSELVNMPIAVTIDGAPRQVRIGEEFGFVVTVINHSDHDLSLDPCPTYQILMSDVKGPGMRELNCAVPVIPAGGSVRFAMRVLIPDYTEYTGPTTLTWTLGDPSQYSPLPTATLKFTITH
jgi:hypothetical protein